MMGRLVLPSRSASSSALLLLVLCAAVLLPTAHAFTPAWRVKAAAQARADALGEEMEDLDCSTEWASTVWVLISTVLVLGMSPALALFEAGMLRSKSTVSLLTQVTSGIITLSMLWLLIGYSLTFGPDHGGFIGDFTHFAFITVSYSGCSEHAPQIPEALFAMFQMMFAVITPLLMTGAFAERLKFRCYIIFICVWELIVYYPLAHWIWGDGFLGRWGTLDFAGGIVIHTSAGIGSIIAAVYLGPRKNFEDFMGEFPPSNLPLAATGFALLWIGWFGFNGGSALAASPLAVSAIVSTQIGCSSGAFTWLVLSWWKGKPSTSALLNGALAGLAGITPASGYVNSPATILLGAIFGIASFFSIHLMKHRWRIDDALDVSSVHGLPGILGAIGLGFFGQLYIDPSGADGAFYGNPMQLVYQIVGVVVALAWAGFWTYVILVLLDKFTPGGLRVNDDEEEVGLDWSEHHEIAYHKLHVLDDERAEEPRYRTHSQMVREQARPAHMDLDAGLLPNGMAQVPLHSISDAPSTSPPDTRSSRMKLNMPSNATYRTTSPGVH